MQVIIELVAAFFIAYGIVAGVWLMMRRSSSPPGYPGMGNGGHFGRRRPQNGKKIPRGGSIDNRSDAENPLG